MKAEERPLDQRRYWDENLDPTNLGDPLVDACATLLAEKDFYLVPDRRFFLELLKYNNCSLVVELGAGLSYEVIMLLQLGYRVIACDLSLSRLQLLRRLVEELLPPEAFSRISFIACKAEFLPFRSNQVPAIATRAVLIHTNLPKALEECKRVLSLSGVAVFSEPLARHPLVRVYRKTFAPREWQTIAQYFDQAQTQLVRGLFPLVSERYDYFFSFLAFVWQYGLRVPFLFWAFLRPLHVLDRLAFCLFPPLRRYAWFVTLICHKSTKQ
ncbi:MAG: class I SAM-dependent methyltransferase [Candidatus Sumerlaeaceae bacterium]|jgi:ubiquinone/menaquinone biosynthesis C-methylase UbiE